MVGIKVAMVCIGWHDIYNYELGKNGMVWIQHGIQRTVDCIGWHDIYIYIYIYIYTHVKYYLFDYDWSMVSA